MAGKLRPRATTSVLNTFLKSTLKMVENDENAHALKSDGNYTQVSHIFLGNN